MRRTGRVIELLSGAVAMALTTTAFAAMGEMEWKGSIYAKFLDGDRQRSEGLYNSSEDGNGDQGQGIEFELLFRNQVSRQVEVGGRLKGRFNTNYWTNFGGFGAEEDDPRSAQYLKVRGTYARITPGYDWLDSAHVGSHDLGLWDAFTVGKIRYIDRDNASGLIFEGSAADGNLRWNVARISLPKLWTGPGFNTGDFSAQDASFASKLQYTPNPDVSVTGIVNYIRDQEIADGEADARDGVGNELRYDNTVVGLKASYSGFNAVDISGAFYWSDYNYDDPANFSFSPALNGSASDSAWLINFDINETPIEDLTFNVQLFDIGAEYVSVIAARREADVLITEGHDGSWGWSRPDYNRGELGNLASRAQVGYGGWNGPAQQVVGSADNDFTDFDEPMAENVIGWKGITITPKYVFGDLELAAEYTYLDYNTDWQACGAASADYCADQFYANEGTHSWGLGGDWRSPFSEFQDKRTQIYVIRGEYSLDIGTGLELVAKYKYIEDEDDRVTSSAFLEDAYGSRTVGPTIDNVRYDDREAEYHTFFISGGYQLTEDLYARFIFERSLVDLIDGTIDVAPVGALDSDTNFFANSGWFEYLTGEHEKNRFGVEMNYFLSGVEFGLTADWIFGTFDPVFYEGVNGQLVRLVPAAGTEFIETALGAIETEKTDLKHYRLKAFMKVQF